MHYLFALPRKNIKYIINISIVSTINSTISIRNSTIFSNINTIYSTILI